MKDIDPESRANLPGVVWPKVGNLSRAALAGLCEQLDETQWWSPERISQRSFAQIESLLAHAIARVPLYRKGLAHLAADLPGAGLREVWPSVPIVNREDLQEGAEECYALDVPAEHGRVTTHQTSGSTGRPLVSRKTDLCGLVWAALTIRDHRWHERDLTRSLAAIRAQPPNFPRGGLSRRSWGAPVDLLYRSGPAHALNVREDIDTQWRWLAEVRPGYLLTHPSNLAALVEHAASRGERLPELIGVRTIGEMLSDELRERTREILGVAIVDCYSAEEVGYIAFQCPRHEHYHVQSEAVLVEIVDDEGEPCRPGEVGRVVLTSLHNYAMPLIRYDIGDYAALGERCPCGRGLPAIERVRGRSRNMLTLPSGERSWPVFSPKGYLPIAPIRQLQVVQTSLEELEVRVVMPREMTVEEEAGLRAYFRDRLGYAFRMRITELQRIEARGGKFEDFVSLVTRAAEGGAVQEGR